jgi:hypothetical protein
LPNYYKIRPSLETTGRDIYFGDSEERRKDLAFIGRLAELGGTKNVWLDLSGEQVLAIVGKRGSGKSFTLGSILESLCSASQNSKLSKITDKRGIVLFDTLDIFWTSKYQLTNIEDPHIANQVARLREWNLAGEELRTKVWIPAGYRNHMTDPEDFLDLYLGASDLDPSDWASLLGVDLVTEPRGQLINQVYFKVTRDGWQSAAEKFGPKTEYSIRDMVACVKGDTDILGDYANETRRAVIQRLQALEDLPMMTTKGTDLAELAQIGQMSVIMMGRLDDDLRTVLASVLVKKMMESRMAASYAKKSIISDPSLKTDQKRRSGLEATIKRSIPRCWIAVDEAQNVVPSDQKTSAQERFVKLVKMGRNMGLSFALTTQQPNAIDPRIMSQVITFIIHQLSTRSDIEGVRANLKSAEIERADYGGRELDFVELIRSLEQGQAIVSSTPTKEISRAFVVNIRPRVSVHGGFEE